jgi:hypothetical protein
MVKCLGFLGDPNPISNRSVNHLLLLPFLFYLFFFFTVSPTFPFTLRLIHAPPWWLWGWRAVVKGGEVCGVWSVAKVFAFGGKFCKVLHGVRLLDVERSRDSLFILKLHVT